MLFHRYVAVWGSLLRYTISKRDGCGDAQLVCDDCIVESNFPPPVSAASRSFSTAYVLEDVSRCIEVR